MRRLAFALLLVLASAALAEAQTGPVVTPGSVQWDQSDHNALDGTQNVITHYVLEIWAPGSDTVSGSPARTSADIPKGTVTPVAGSANRYVLTRTNWLGLDVPLGPTWVMTILSKGPGGTARSPISNSFMFPIPVRAPKPATGVTVQ